MTTLNQPYYRILEAADLLRVSRRTIERLIAAGELVRVKVGHTTLIPADHLERYIDRNTEQHA